MEAYEESRFGVWFFEHKLISIPAFFVLFFIISIAVGYIDKRLIRGLEYTEITKTNPYMEDLTKKVNEIHESVKKD
jgi:hypothetical protein